MRALFLASTCLAVATAAQAETSITTATTTPVRTSTVNAGAADSINISSAGSITLTAAGAAVTVDSAHKVTNAGSIVFSNVDGATGILAAPGTSGGIVNSGKITIDETYTATDGDNDGDLDGPFAVGSNRVGIRTQGAYSGDISNSGTITIEGNDSAGIRLGGALTGNFTHNGTTSVVGDRALAVALQDVSGSVRLAGTIGAQGVNAVAARIDGNIGGTLTVQGNLGSTGYRSTTAITTADADDLLQGGSALIIAGDVAGGVILAVPPTDSSSTDNDEDKDGIPDADEGSALVRSYGAAPAMVVGANGRDIAIGAVPGTGTGYGLIIDGTVSGLGVYTGVTGNGLVVGGQGGNVAIAGGIGINGAVTSSSVGASTTAVRIGNGASTPLLHVKGQVTAAGAGVAGTVATAVAIDVGASLPALKNAGSIKATAAATAGGATAIVDKSGTLALIENSGAISATGAESGSGRNIAIDVSGTATGVAVKQTVVASGYTAPTIVGDIFFGSGADTLDIADGKVTGNTNFGAGADTLKLSGDAVYAGKVSFGDGGATMALSGTSAFTGTVDFGGAAGTLSIGTGSGMAAQLNNAANVAVSIAGGGLDFTGSTRIASLAVTDEGAIGVTLNQAGNTTPIIDVAGAASFGEDSTLVIKVTDLSAAVGTHLVLSAGTLTGADNIETNSVLLPYMYKGTLATSGNQLSVTVESKSRDELGLNRSEAAAFDAIHAVMIADEDIGASFVSLTDGDDFRTTLRQMLPEHAGGVFAAVTQGSRSFLRALEDPTGPFVDNGNWGYWVNQSGWGLNKAIGDTAGFNMSGWGFGGGVERKTGIGSFGGSIAYLWSQSQDKGSANEVQINQFEFSGYWRLKKGPLRATARGSYSIVDLDSSRTFTGTDGEEAFERTSIASHAGKLWSGAASVSYDKSFGAFSIRPNVSIDYYKLTENGYAETGGDSVDLVVQSRTSDELAVEGNVALGFQGGGEDEYEGWSRMELEAGRRQIVSGRLGNTVARIGEGEQFVLNPGDRESGWTGRLRGIIGNNAFQVSGEAGAEQQQDRWALSLRLGLRIGL